MSSRLAEYGLVALGAVFLGGAILNFIWFWQEAYPRSTPTLIAVPGCLIAFLWCFKLAAGHMIRRLTTTSTSPPA